MQAQFGCAPGVVRTRVGFTGGRTDNPTYRNIGDHTETVEVEWDPAVTDYPALLSLFWAGHDPTAPAYSRQYMSVIFWHDKQQQQQAEQSLAAARATAKREVATVLLPAEQFYPAEE